MRAISFPDTCARVCLHFDVDNNPMPWVILLVTGREAH
jgi:hypothetical protein